MGQQKYCSSCGGLYRHSELPKPKEKYQKHFFFFNIRVCGIPHICPATRLRKLTRPIKVMANYDKIMCSGIMWSDSRTCIAYLLKLRGQREAA